MILSSYSNHWATTLAFALLCAGCRSVPSAEAQHVDMDIPVITRGQALDLKPKAALGVVTVFDFFAEWCAPCREVERSLLALKNTYGSRLAIRKLDLVSFESELAQAFSIRDLPYLIVYNERRELLDQGPSAKVLPNLIAYLNQP